MYLFFVGGGGGFGSVCGTHCSGFITYYYEAKYRLYGSLQLHLHPRRFAVNVFSPIPDACESSLESYPIRHL